MEIEQNIWGFSDNGDAVILYTMTNSTGAYLKLTNIGASIVGIGVPDRNGKIEDVALGFSTMEGYLSDHGVFLGNTCGRYSNRIAKGKFTLNGKEYRLAVNNFPNHLHGGPNGLSNILWQCRTEVNRVIFSYTSPAGEERYPGTVGIEVVYDWSDDSELEITYYAKTDEPTIINLTNHVYLNLSGEGNGDILGHELKLNAQKYLPTDKFAIPFGRFDSVEGTPFDFTSERRIGQDIDSDNEQIVFGNGYDHSFAIDGWERDKMVEAGYLYEPESGRKVEVFTTMPDIHLYSGNYLEGCGINKAGTEHERRSGMALECQFFPDSPNQPNFPSVVLNPEDDYEQHIIYRFSAQ